MKLQFIQSLFPNSMIGLQLTVKDLLWGEGAPWLGTSLVGNICSKLSKKEHNYT